MRISLKNYSDRHPQFFVFPRTYRSVDGDRDQESINLQRQLKVVEQEASVLRTRICSLETENEKLSNENKQLAISNLSKKTSLQADADLKSKISSLEQQLDQARKLVISSYSRLFPIK